MRNTLSCEDLLFLSPFNEEKLCSTEMMAIRAYNVTWTPLLCCKIMHRQLFILLNFYPAFPQLNCAQGMKRVSHPK